MATTKEIFNLKQSNMVNPQQSLSTCDACSKKELGANITEIPPPATTKQDRKAWEKKLAIELTATIASFTEALLIADEHLIQMIDDYVFKNADNKALLEATLTKLVKEIPSFHQENLEILFLALEGAMMIAQEHDLNPKQFSNFMVAKKFKVKERIIARQERKQQNKRPSDLKIISHRKSRINFRNDNAFWGRRSSS